MRGLSVAGILLLKNNSLLNIKIIITFVSILLLPLTLVTVTVTSSPVHSLDMEVSHSNSKPRYYYHSRIHPNRFNSMEPGNTVEFKRSKNPGPEPNKSSSILSPSAFVTKALDSLSYLFFKYSNDSSPYIILVGDDKEKLEAKLNNSFKDLSNYNYYYNNVNKLGNDTSPNTRISDPSRANYNYYSGNYSSKDYTSNNYTRSNNNIVSNDDEINKASEKNTTGKRASRGREKEKEPTATTSTMEKPSGEGEGPWINDLTWDDATWILTASFIIFTMQTGFGMLESGCVSVRNESNIMMKNVVDVVFGGLTYWLFGFSISFGTDAGSTPYYGVGEYLVDSDNNLMGPVFAAFMFQLSFATTATTIVSGTMAERCNFKAYCLFSMLNTVVYCVPASCSKEFSKDAPDVLNLNDIRWVWGPTGFLGEMGLIDIAGSGAVHLLGGVSGFTAAWLLGPRLGRYENGTAALPLGNPTSCIVGLYILWWGWLAFNSGSTFGVSGVKWKFAARAATTTLIASIGGGVIGSLWTLIKPGRIFEVMDIVNPVLGALVAVTAGCALYHTIDAFVVGVIGGIVVIMTNWIPDACRVDDPVGATAVHAFGGLWGLVAVAIFAENDEGLGFTKEHAGLLRGGDWYLMKVQLFGALCITIWSFCVSFCLLWVINKLIPIRMEPHEELLGADFVEHLVLRREFELTNALAVFGSDPEIREVREQAQYVGSSNPTHETINNKIKTLGKATRWKRLKAKTVVASAFMTILQENHSRRVSLTDVGVADKREELPTIIVQSESNEREESQFYDPVKDYLGHPFTISEHVPYQNYNNYTLISNQVHHLNNPVTLTPNGSTH